MLRQFPDSRLRQTLAKNHNTPVSVLEKLARDSCNWVRWRVAENPYTPVSVLEKLVSNNEISFGESVKLYVN